MKIGGVQKLSLVDYPGHTCVALFTIGCNMRCGYCHNPELVLPERYAPTIPSDEILQFLATRVGRVEGVAISGGEPTMHEDLPDFIRQIRKLGFRIKLDTNGTNPSMLATLYEDALLDFVAMDIKAPLYKYQQVVARPIDIEAIKTCIDMIKHSGIGHEFRATIVKSQLSHEDIKAIAHLVDGAERFALQKFRTGHTLSPQFESETTYSDAVFEQFKIYMEQFVRHCVVH